MRTRLSRSEQAVLSVLLRQSDADNLCRLSQPEIAQQAGVSLRQTANVITRLIARGSIAIRQHTRGRGNRTLYYVNPENMQLSQPERVQNMQLSEKNMQFSSENMQLSPPQGVENMQFSSENMQLSENEGKENMQLSGENMQLSESVDESCMFYEPSTSHAHTRARSYSTNTRKDRTTETTKKEREIKKKTTTTTTERDHSSEPTGARVTEAEQSSSSSFDLSTPDTQPQDTDYGRISPLSNEANAQRMIAQWRESQSAQEARAALTFKDVANAYHAEFGIISAMIGEQIGDAVDTYGADWVMDAMKVAVTANKRQFSYVLGILRNWFTNGKKEQSAQGEYANPDFGKYLPKDVRAALLKAQQDKSRNAALQGV